MSNDEMKRLAEVVRTIVREENKPIIGELKSHTMQLKSQGEELKANTEETKATSDQVAHLTEVVNGEIIPTLEKHTKYFKQIAGRLEIDKDNIQRLDRRQTDVEARMGVVPAAELHIIK